MAVPSLVTAQAQVAVDQAARDYRVGIGDILKISVYRAPDLETTVRVSGNGSIVFGPLGDVRVLGLTPAQIGDQLAQALKNGGYYVSPAVNVAVSEYHAHVVSILGAVARPGEYPVDLQGLSVVELLARSGANFQSGGSRVSISSKPGTPAQDFTVADLLAGSKPLVMNGGESIFVQMPSLVYVRGEVQRPGAYPIDPDMTVDQAIAVAGGLTARGSQSRVRIAHKVEAGYSQYSAAKVRDIVKPNDTIIVGSRIF